jgi:hypothetical protein
MVCFTHYGFCGDVLGDYLASVAGILYKTSEGLLVRVHLRATDGAKNGTAWGALPAHHAGLINYG